MKIKKGYDFDDLLLVPRLSTVNSRDFVDLSIRLGALKLEVPIIASPMRGIISPELIIKLSHLGSVGILHRFYEKDSYKNYDAIRNDILLIRDNCKNWGLSLSLKDNWYLDLMEYNPSIICIDLANGNLDTVREWVSNVKGSISRRNLRTLLMAGNVATKEAAQKLVNAGADMIRIGIGNGALCTTRNVTGVGVPQLTALMDCKDIKAIKVADGGIRNSGDAVKALAAGADVVMIGSLFGQTFESAHNGIIYGMASRTLQEEYYHAVKSVEGIEIPVEKRVIVKDLIDEFTWGMKSAFTYLNARNIKELQKNATWIETGTGSIKKL